MDEERAPMNSSEEILDMVEKGDNGHSTKVKTERYEDKKVNGNMFRRFFKENLFLVCNIVAIIIGFLIGMFARSSHIGEDGLLWLGLPGEIYMRILKCIIVPLIVCSVIDGTANTDPRTNGKLGLVSFTYMIISNSIGAVIGLLLCVLFKPGSGVKKENVAGGVDTRHLSTMDIVADFIRNVFPPNMVGAALEVSQTRHTAREVVSVVNISGQLVNQTSTVMVRSLGTVSSTNILGLIVISAALGIAASQAGPKARPFLDFFKAGATIIFKLFSWIKWTTPLGTASLIAASIAGLDNLGPAFRALGFLTILVAGGNWGVIQLVGQPVLFFLIRRQNPLQFFMKGARAWLMAFGAINSTIPYLEYVRAAGLFHVDPRVTEYVLPISVTLNRCGSALFITATSMFVIQYTGSSSDVGVIVTVGVLGIIASLAIPAVNSSSVVASVIILDSLGVPSTGAVGLVMAMEWFNDRVRTTSNCMSHIMCILTTWRLCKTGFTPVRTDTIQEHDKISRVGV